MLPRWWVNFSQFHKFFLSLRFFTCSKNFKIKIVNSRLNSCHLYNFGNWQDISLTVRKPLPLPKGPLFEFEPFIKGRLRKTTRNFAKVMETGRDPAGSFDIMQDFELIMSGKANDIHDVKKYRSKSTGLEVVMADIEGPQVNGYIVLATRPDSDDGLPHTLEHLVFMGSEDYPYKGVLDILANKCYASGTNAWTDVDHTSYTLTTAGSEGFCNMIGIYMDHIFYPTLTDSAFVTEVYHVNGECTDNGVVYCEIQGCENTAEETLYRELVTTIYPKTSGYHYNFGGACKNLRESCNNEKVREFHKKFYHPKNTCLIVCGSITPEELFPALESTIKKLCHKGVVDEWTKPWLDEIPEIDNPIEKHVKFPSEEEDDILTMVGFRGPSAINEVDVLASMRLLFEYLTDSSVGALQLAFVENDDPICSQVSYAELENSQTTFYIEFEGVLPEKTKKVLPVLKETLESQLTNFDFGRMQDMVRKSFQEELSAMENSPHKSIAYAVIGDFLYGSDNKEIFLKRINASKTISSFLEKPESFWTDLIKERVLQQKWITIYASPCSKTAADFAKQEQERVQGRLSLLGQPGVEKLAKDLEEAIKNNSTPAPASILEKVKTPCTSSIKFHSITRYENPEWTSELKCNFYLDDIKSNFVYFSLHLDTTCLTLEQRKFLPLFKELLVQSPVVIEDGTEIPFEGVVACLNRAWVTYECAVGVGARGTFTSGSYSHILVFDCQMELDKLEDGFQWLNRILWKVKWSPERAKVVAAKLAGEIPQMKRKGHRMAHIMLSDILYKMNSNVKAQSINRQLHFMKDLSSMKGEEIVKNLEAIKSAVLLPQNSTVHIACCLEKFKHHVGDTRHGSIGKIVSETLNFPGDRIVRLANQKDQEWMKDFGCFIEKPEHRILGNRTEDASYLIKVVPGPNNHLHPDVPKILVALNYFCQTEGPLYAGVRGAGLAYGISMDLHCHEGLLYFTLYQSSDVVAAFFAAKSIVLDHLNGVESWTEEFLCSSKSSLIFEYIDETPVALSWTSLFSYYKNVPGTYTQDIINKISAVTLNDLQEVTEKYLRPLVTDESVCSIVSPQGKVASTVQGFMKNDFKIVPVTGITNSFLEKWTED